MHAIRWRLKTERSNMNRMLSECRAKQMNVFVKNNSIDSSCLSPCKGRYFTNCLLRRAWEKHQHTFTYSLRMSEPLWSREPWSRIPTTHYFWIYSYFFLLIWILKKRQILSVICLALSGPQSLACGMCRSGIKQTAASIIFTSLLSLTAKSHCRESTLY